jgi:hypothetical protein
MMDTSKTKDAFDQWWEWANKPPESLLMISAEIHNAVMTLTEEERLDRAIVNEAVRTGGSPWRLVGSADRYGVPRAEE